MGYALVSIVSISGISVVRKFDVKCLVVSSYVFCCCCCLLFCCLYILRRCV